MLRRTLLAGAGVAAAAAAALPALASTPATGTVSAASPKVAWTGTANGYGVLPTNLLLTTAGADPVCPPQACDTFQLTVADSADLVVTAASDTKDQFTQLHVHKPDGTTIYVDSDQGKPAVAKVRSAPKGQYTIDVITNDTVADPGKYDASAELKVAPAPAPPATPGAPATPPPSAGPAPAKPAATLTLRTTRLSARRARRAPKLALSSSSPVTGVKAVIRRGAKVLGSARMARLSGTATLRFKLRKPLKPGRYTFAATASDNGRTVGVSAPLKVSG